ncbi:MAG TPA: hypothetical protein VJ141_00990 [Candidatus Limnocylindrales bacterium]|nr:hypothetical protein [Candidatus Limnocylindrales bacterium]
MFSARNAIFIGLGFILVAIAYLLLTADSGRLEMAGVVMLATLGVAMGITFYVVFRNSGEL